MVCGLCVIIACKLLTTFFFYRRIFHQVSDGLATERVVMSGGTGVVSQREGFIHLHRAANKCGALEDKEVYLLTQSAPFTFIIIWKVTPESSSIF